MTQQEKADIAREWAEDKPIFYVKHKIQELVTKNNGDTTEAYAYLYDQFKLGDWVSKKEEKSIVEIAEHLTTCKMDAMILLKKILDEYEKDISSRLGKLAKSLKTKLGGGEF